MLPMPTAIATASTRSSCTLSRHPSYVSSPVASETFTLKFVSSLTSAGPSASPAAILSRSVWNTATIEESAAPPRLSLYDSASAAAGASGSRPRYRVRRAGRRARRASGYSRCSPCTSTPATSPRSPCAKTFARLLSNPLGKTCEFHAADTSILARSVMIRDQYWSHRP